MKFVSENTSK